MALVTITIAPEEADDGAGSSAASSEWEESVPNNPASAIVEKINFMVAYTGQTTWERVQVC